MKRSCILSLMLAVATNAAYAEPLTVSRGSDALTRNLSLPVGKATIVKLPQAVKEILVANPDVVDTVVRSSNQIYLFGKKAGATNIFFFNTEGKQQAVLEVNVGQDAEQIEKLLRDSIPGGQISAKSVGTSIVLSGTVVSAAHVANAMALVAKVTQGTDNIINNIKVSGQEQVNIRVKVSEVNRSITKNLGIDWSTGFALGNVALGLATKGGAIVPGAATGPAYTMLGSSFDTASTTAGILPATGLTSSATEALKTLVTQMDAAKAAADAARASLISGDLTDAVRTLTTEEYNRQMAAHVAYAQRATQLQQRIANGVSYNGLANRNAAIQTKRFGADAALNALEKHSLARTLAEPTLTAISGESARFVSGGEFPYAVAGALGVASTSFKPYGMNLAFTPTVLADNRINLKINTQFSNISGTVAAGEVPSLDTRSAETTVEVPSGGTIVLAGMLQENNVRSLQSTPGLKDIPVIGPAINKNDYLGTENELIILATPYLVQPVHLSKLALPTDGYAPPSDGDLYLGGRMHGVYGGADDKQQTKADRAAMGANGAAALTMPAQTNSTNAAQAAAAQVLE